MPSMVVKNIDPGVWAAFKRRAKKDGHTQRWILMRLIRVYLRAGLPALEECAGVGKRAAA
jgi:hypothetical protein